MMLFGNYINNRYDKKQNICACPMICIGVVGNVTNVGKSRVFLASPVKCHESPDAQLLLIDLSLMKKEA